MREAVEDHRASAARPPRNLYGRIVAAADRLIDPDTVCRRTVQYGLAHYPALDREAHFRRFRDHLLEKYAAGGDLRLPPAAPANQRRRDARRPRLGDPATLGRAFDRLYDAERETR